MFFRVYSGASSIRMLKSVKASRWMSFAPGNSTVTPSFCFLSRNPPNCSIDAWTLCMSSLEKASQPHIRFKFNCFPLSFHLVLSFQVRKNGVKSCHKAEHFTLHTRAIHCAGWWGWKLLEKNKLRSGLRLQHRVLIESFECACEVKNSYFMHNNEHPIRLQRYCSSK